MKKQIKIRLLIIGIFLLILGIGMSMKKKSVNRKMHSDSHTSFLQASSISRGSYSTPANPSSIHFSGVKKTGQSSTNTQSSIHTQSSINTQPSINTQSSTKAQSDKSWNRSYLHASQGIEVHIDGLSWMGELVTERLNSVGLYSQSINAIHYDPDNLSTGYPDLFININNVPTVYNHHFLSGILKYNSKGDRPYKTYTFNKEGHKKIRMELWLMTFDMTFRIEASEKSSQSARLKTRKKIEPEDTLHTATNPLIHHRKFRKPYKPEYKSPAYEDMVLQLSIVPKNDHWYISTLEEGAYRPVSEHPDIAIAAIECIEIKKIEDEKIVIDDSGLGVNLSKGQLLPINILPEIYTADHFNTSKIIMNPNLFNREINTSIRIHNLGMHESRRNNIWQSKQYVGDYYHAKFLIHLYVVGEWMIKDGAYLKYEPGEAQVLTNKSIMDSLLPDFNLGFFGKFLSSGMLILIIVLAISLLFPPVIQIINLLLQRIVAVLKK